MTPDPFDALSEWVREQFEFLRRSIGQRLRRMREQL